MEKVVFESVRTYVSEILSLKLVFSVEKDVINVVVVNEVLC